MKKVGILAAFASFASILLVGLGLWSVVKIEDSLEEFEFEDNGCESGCEGDLGCC